MTEITEFITTTTTTVRNLKILCSNVSHCRDFRTLVNLACCSKFTIVTVGYWYHFTWTIVFKSQLL